MFVFGVKPNCCLILWGIISVGGMLLVDGYVVFDIGLFTGLRFSGSWALVFSFFDSSLPCVLDCSVVCHPKKPSILAATVGCVSSVLLAACGCGGVISVISPEEQHQPYPEYCLLTYSIFWLDPYMFWWALFDESLDPVNTTLLWCWLLSS